MVPVDPLDVIRSCVRRRRVLWTYHVNMRMQGRGISRETILAARATYEIIESYPDDKYLPSYLVFARNQGAVFHVWFAVDITDDNVRIITAYTPDPVRWGSDLKSRNRL